MPVILHHRCCTVDGCVCTGRCVTLPLCVSALTWLCCHGVVVADSHVAVVIPIDNVLYFVQPSWEGLHATPVYDRVQRLTASHQAFRLRRLDASLTDAMYDTLDALGELVRLGFRWGR